MARFFYLKTDILTMHSTQVSEDKFIQCRGATADQEVVKETEIRKPVWESLLGGDNVSGIGLTSRETARGRSNGRQCWGLFSSVTFYSR